MSLFDLMQILYNRGMGHQEEPTENIFLINIIPNLRDIVFIAIFCTALLLGPRMLNMDGDLPRHLAIGKYVLQGHLPPTNDIFSYTRYGAPFAPHKWLSGVLFYISYVLFNEKGIALLSGIVLATTFALIYADSVARTGLRVSTFFLVAGGAAISSLHWIARPHLFTMLLLAVWLIWNEKLASGKHIPLWYFPAGMLIWNNIHGEFISGFLVTGASLAGWMWDYVFNRDAAKIIVGKRIGLVLVLITLVTILNPVSFRAWSTVTSWMGNEYLLSHTQETVPPDFLQSKFLILLAFIAFTVFLLAMKREKLSARNAIILAGFTAMTLLSARNVHLYGIVAPFVLAGTFTTSQNVPIFNQIEETFSKFESRISAFIWPGITVMLGTVLLATTAIGRMERFSPNYFPVQAVQWLRDHPQEGNMFNPFDWGGYISFTLWPEYRVFIDSQGDVYGEAFIREYEQVITLKPGWQDVLDTYQVDWAMVPSRWPLANALAYDGWDEIYADNTAIILRRGR
jgi:hypothetical protein